MEYLKELKAKLEFENNPIFKEAKEEKEEKKKKKKGRAIEYRSTTRKTKGRAFQITYDIDYLELNDFLKEKVKGISWTPKKTRETFKAIRSFTGFADPRKEKASKE